MKYLIILFLLFCCRTAYADSKEAIQSRAEWVESQYEKRVMSESDAVAEIQDLKRRALALNEPVTYQSSPVNTQKIAEIGGTSLLRQATVPGPAGWSVFRFLGGLSGWGLIIFVIISGIALFTLVIVSAILIDYAKAAEAAQQSRVQATAPTADRNSGPSLASVIGTVPVRPIPQGHSQLIYLHVCDDHESEETLIARGYSWSNPEHVAFLREAREADRARERRHRSQLHSGEVPDHLI